MLGIRQKQILAFGSLLTIIIIIGIMIMIQINELGQAIDVILKENYRSVIACQEMKESLERIDSGILYTLTGNDTDGKKLIEEYIIKFRTSLDAERNNITLPDEKQKAEEIKILFAEYLSAIPHVIDSEHALGARRNNYFSALQPLFDKIKNLSQEILFLNQSNMNTANNNARHLAEVSHNVMLTAIIISAFLSFLFSFLAHRWILFPINRLIESTTEIKHGNLDLVLKIDNKDEIGKLAESFNAMTSALRQERNKDRMNLMRIRQATEETFRALPTAVAVLDTDGKVEISTETAVRYFGLRPGIPISDLKYQWLESLIKMALDKCHVVEKDSREGIIQQFINNREYFFLPMVIPIPMNQENIEPTGIVLILKDVTQIIEQQELKHSVLSTVIHQLKTPLTSLQMSVYLIMEERLGVLNEKQKELLMTSRDDIRRLLEILDDLLSLKRIESGKSYLSPEPYSPHIFIKDTIETFIAEAKDKNIAIINVVPENLPKVLVDIKRIKYVFSNLLSNAIRFTNPGGSVKIKASLGENQVSFQIEDTGAGIPREHLKHLFEPFYRVPGQDEKTGAGLGLTIIKEIIKAHGGAVKVESIIKKGSTFSFTLPRAD